MIIETGRNIFLEKRLLDTDSFASKYPQLFDSYRTDHKKVVLLKIPFRTMGSDEGTILENYYLTVNDNLMVLSLNRSKSAATKLADKGLIESMIKAGIGGDKGINLRNIGGESMTELQIHLANIDTLKRTPGYFSQDVE
ncbi:TPA: hypothetical protein DIC29_02155 [Candidatus Shapirobacteria bacterium]|uniref:Uncharacterized protein n=2 Tax=Patescibacteria group TaxID=1783273 RepID=A0A0G0JQ60_9BACT|nr:MAG: hypothetical protein US90_C0013G0034 [Candidatus Shapirobacteria bacterium GW2011_GWE2_38_30]OGJ06450.1 MAG: hypothetical protein A2192_02545 [Candidatus Nomurabacteria bacterium RIFOXYA1_FULL_35_17]HAP37461.1 hypothetical protein [Candidatus Shapirobacteria bacterium]HCU55243.1 hypothetical protein [Candidatus Shapirobacteria bacterium]